MQSAVELHSRLNVSTLQSSVFIRGDLKFQCGGFLYTQERGDIICQQGGDTLVVNNFRHLCSEHDDSYFNISYSIFLILKYATLPGNVFDVAMTLPKKRGILI